MSVRITCIKKNNGDHENPFTAIEELGWINEDTKETGRVSRVDLYNWINNGGKAYVRDVFGNIAYLITEITGRGTKYVKTIADKTTADNLLKLIECKG